MSLRNCPECGRLFECTLRNLCPDCIQKEDEDFQKIKQFLRENQGGSITEISEKTGVSERRILSFLKEGRLVITKGDDSTALLKCMRCGKPISRGCYCKECCLSLNKLLNESSQKTRNQASQEAKVGQGSFTNHFQK